MPITQTKCSRQAFFCFFVSNTQDKLSTTKRHKPKQLMIWVIKINCMGRFHGPIVRSNMGNKCG